MKQQAIELAQGYYGCKARYSGKERTLYVSGENAKEAVTAIKGTLKPTFEVKVDKNEE